MRMPTVLGFALLASSFVAPVALAQEGGGPGPGPGGVAESGMGQGHASVATRSDVSISLESVPGTSGARIAVLGRSVTSAMSQIRACYAQAINRAPGTHGRMRLRLDMPAESGTPNVAAPEPAFTSRKSA